ncbi:RHS repeat-associated core domain-containing protein [Flavobacterium sp. DG1-102-2]|uniref:RHS repeat-associated core domain-containing protein n=1 Tax=Flavobacterium sp. DG1-102-2 TaxID=3081663 RepID=UPI00294A7BB2|nr:RHS repeat-associated core domain-containing protein [Flavobacterium sp. DG1-102-2]MDV6170293.1 RHS repeat-associated core domain-containing protein [Flavobacterium sp. DG1-102-2]
MKYNGKELQDELGLNIYDYGARNYDPAIGRWFNIDPKAEKYKNWSPYAYVGNMPTIAIDPNGEELIFVIRDNKGNAVKTLTYKRGNFYHGNGKRYNPGKEGLSKTMYTVLSAYRAIEASDDDVLKHQLRTLEKIKNKHFMQEGIAGQGSDVDPYPYGIGKDDAVGTIANFDFSGDKSEEESMSTVAHEMRHQYDWDTRNMSNDKKGATAGDPAEIRAVWTQNRMNKILDLPKRTKYGGQEIDPNKLDNPPNNGNAFDGQYKPEVRNKNEIKD